MARSLNGGERAPPKAVKPLRYRIDPTAEKLDALDKLETELEWQNRTQALDPELYFELKDKLQADRAALTKKRDKDLPPELPPPIKTGWEGPLQDRPEKALWSVGRIILICLILYIVWKFLTNSS